AADWDFEGAKPAQPVAPLPALVTPPAGPPLATATAQPQIVFNPQDITQTGTAKVTINATVGGTALPAFSLNNLSITGNSADHFAIIPEDSGNWSAIGCYKVTVQAQDAANVVADYYAGLKTLTWTLTL